MKFIFSFELPWLIEFVIRGIEISFKRRLRAIQSILTGKRISETQFIRVSLFSLSLSYLVYGNILRGENYRDIFTNKESFLPNEIYRRFSFQTCYCELLYLFFVESSVLLLSNNCRETICRFHFGNAIETSETPSRNFLFNYQSTIRNLPDIIFRFRKLFSFPISVIFTAASNDNEELSIH